MATKTKTKTVVSEGEVSVQSLPEYAKSAMWQYASATIEDRALPDIYDGLKPVHRRVLYAMYDIGLSSKHEPIKASKITGHVMGGFHPHGDSSINSAMETLANQPVAPIRGVGNWGSFTEKAGAARYINATLSKYADLCMFDPRYTAVTDYVPNYDEKGIEPVVLPCLLPNLLLNGCTMGIAVAVTSCIPSFEPKGVLEMVRQVMGGKKPTPADYAKVMNLNYQYGGKVYLGDKEPKAEWQSFFKTGVGSIYVEPQYRMLDTHHIQVYGVPPNLGLEKTIANLGEYETVKMVYESTDIKGTDPMTIDIVLKPIKNSGEREGAIAEVMEAFYTKMHFKTNVTVRTYNAKSNKVETKFLATNVPQIVEMWVTRRLELENLSLKYQLSVVDAKIVRVGLMILAVDNRKLVLAALDSKDPDAALAKSLKIKLEDAKTILDLQVRRLSSMDGTKLRAELKALQAQKKEIQGWIKKPRDKILADLSVLEKAMDW